MTPWKITRAVYKYSTYDTSKVGYPSDGPGKTYVLTAEAHPEFQPLILQVLDETKVNNEVTLRAYIDLLRSGDRDEVQRIDALGPSPRQPTGSGVNRSFAIYDGENQVYEFVGNFRRYSGDHVVNLYKLTIDPKNQLPVDPLDSAHPAEEHRLPRRSTSPPPPSPQE